MKGEKKYREASENLDILYSRSLINYTEKIEIYNKYLVLIRSAAYLGNHKAQFELALHYEEVNFFGLNMNHSKRRAIYWYKQACEGNMPDACNNIATWYYSEGKKEEAIALYKKAISLGSVLAKKNLRGLI